MCIDQPFLNSALARGEWSAPRPGHFTSGKRAPGTHWIRGWVDPRTDQDDVERIKILPHSNSDPSAVLPVASRYTDCAIPAPRERIEHAIF
jgi:hypothetical protein